MSRLIAQLHIARAKLGMSEADYRAVLVARTGKESSKDMSEAERAHALDGFIALGFQPAARFARRNAARPARIKKIYALWGELQTLDAVVSGPKGAQALREWVKRQTGVENPDWLTVSQSRACAEALKQWIARIKGGKDGNGN